MYQHHIDSIEIMKKYFYDRQETIALVFGGSVAKGCEREDSDLDGMVIISEEDYQKRVKNKSTVETICDLCTYKSGYFDVKYMTKQFLIDAAEKASEPTRNSFIKSRVLFSHDSEIEEIVKRIPVFQKDLKEEKMLSFYSDFWLNYYYFLKGCPVDGYMKLHAINEIIYSIYRMILQENEILFPSNRRLEETVASAPDKPENIVTLGKSLAEKQDIVTADSFVEAYLSWSKWKRPEDINQVLSCYSADFEQWWRVSRPLVVEW